MLLIIGVTALIIWRFGNATPSSPLSPSPPPYGKFPKPNDPFQFLPCTSETLPPALEDPNPEKTWAAKFDPDPGHWSWGNATTNSASEHDEYQGRGIYLCGYLDVPLDYTNASDGRIVRLAVNKFQVSGLAKVNEDGGGRGRKSERTIVLNPGGPGGSGTSYLWRGAEGVTERFSGGVFDVLGWDPRGVNASLPSMACFPADADRDRYSLLSNQAHDESTSPLAQLRVADAINNATFAACKEIHGDLPRFLGTAFVARDLEQIRIALGEPELTGYLVSYGTGIGQTYANMFPNSVGRIILDGTEYVRDHRLLGGFGWTALDNGTDAWHDGFLSECIAAGPEHCALAKPLNPSSKNVTLEDLQNRIFTLLDSLIANPLPAYTTHSGPSLITYSTLVSALYGAMYSALTWPSLALALSEFEKQNTTLMARMLDRAEWEYDPTLPCPATRRKPHTDELTALVICADSHDAPLPPFTPKDAQTDPDGLRWWTSLWKNMTAQSWIAGDSRFYNVFPCRHYTSTFGAAVGAYRGDLNHTLAHPVLLVAETYDPATPLRNGRRLLAEMGENARLVVHHGYGHSSRDTSACTERILREFVLEGVVPEGRETECWADGKPYRYGEGEGEVVLGESGGGLDPSAEALRVWREEMAELRGVQPGLFR
ncbi:hypothetical protein M409DRAFT_36532 [Zasmidium cellare ATCC 36951]|uniref:Peptidase S33 tripeptidyl aminopeptidase-like C-terminal domain-containing protein n=1 Tax=Zasmidium cellare ATCC 36951 TaxID=1080233 RepID=A0A6A6CML6_ZASCE|nr:uncharacterized protein M409DRAFT_36532 [Zasmidium cellare ATCC 36951]KAF2167863.1 hypothetical protein M409DRAFT_36532 [Zasmidium cellare ATCC 36951]